MLCSANLSSNQECILAYQILPNGQRCSLCRRCLAASASSGTGRFSDREQTGPCVPRSNLVWMMSSILVLAAIVSDNHVSEVARYCSRKKKSKRRHFSRESKSTMNSLWKVPPHKRAKRECALIRNCSGNFTPGCTSRMRSLDPESGLRASAEVRGLAHP